VNKDAYNADVLMRCEQATSWYFQTANSCLMMSRPATVSISACNRQPRRSLTRVRSA